MIMAVKQRLGKILSLLKKEYPQVKTVLCFSSPLEILVSTILSAQCTDVRVNLVTKSLFKKYKNLRDYAMADIKIFEQDIRSTGFYKNKAKNIINTAKKIIKEFGKEVPNSMEKLTQLPGVARKTANIVLFNGFGEIEGIAVDTHVRRLSIKLGLSKNNNPEKIEQDLMRLLKRSKRTAFCNLLIAHARKICNAKKPKCPECILKDICLRKIKGDLLLN